VVNQYGQPAAGVPVYICNAATSTGIPCTPVVPIYYDYSLLSPAPNPIQTDANGNYNVYVPALAYPNTYIANAVTGYGTPTTQLYPGPGNITYTSGTINYIPKVSATTPLGFVNSSLSDTGSQASPTGLLSTPEAFQSLSLTSTTFVVNNARVGVDGTTNGFNTFVGRSALLNIAAPPNCGGSNIGCYNTAVGDQSMYNSTDPSDNAAFGEGSLYWNSTGSFNTAIGEGAEEENRTGASNVSVGQASLFWNEIGSYSTAIGTEALNGNGTASADTENVAVGFESMLITNGGSYNASVGSASLVANTTGGSNSALGQQACQANTTGSGNVCIGFESGGSNTTGSENVWIGNGAGPGSNTAFTNSICIGLSCTNTGSNQAIIGNSGVANIYGGSAAGDAIFNGLAFNASSPTEAFQIAGLAILAEPNSDGTSIAVGGHALENQSGTTFDNAAVGAGALELSTSGTQDTAVGTLALGSNTTGSASTGIGEFALETSTTGNYNVALGELAGYGNITGSDNTWIGQGTGPGANTALTNDTCVGQGCTNTASNQAIVGDNAVTDFYAGSAAADAYIHGWGFYATQGGCSGTDPMILYNGTCGPLVPIRAGSWSISSSTTVAVTFSTAMGSTPTSCSVTPGASAASTGVPFATSLATTGFTVNVPSSGTLAGTYQCVINNAN